MAQSKYASPRRYLSLNRILLFEALGDTQAASDFLQLVFAETGNSAVQSAISRVNRILSDQAAIASEFASPRTAAERVAAHASDEVQRVLSANARLFIVNNAAREQNLANDIIDNMTSIFIRRGIRLVDRQSIDMIIIEQNFQLTGYVSDHEIMNIGNLAGANSAVIISITGTGAARRLQVRVLDLERGIPILHSDTSEAWRL